MGAPLLEIHDLQKHFLVKKSFSAQNRVYLKAVDGVDLTMEKGETIGLVGESGCGKSTLGRTILKLHSVTGGQIVYEGKDITKYTPDQMMEYRRKMQLIFQDPFASLNPRKTIMQSVEAPLDLSHDIPKAERRERVIKMLDVVGLGEKYLNKYPHELSGGQRQRIVIARALINNPEMVVCDEPVSALDVSIQAQIINLLKQLQKDFGFTYLFISHDLSVVEHISDTVGVMYLGSMVEYADTDKIFAHPLHPYTEALFSAIPIPDPDVKMKRIILKGSLPSPANPPYGCKFHTRCEKCMEVCKYAVPEWAEVEPEHWCACHLYDDAERKARAEQAMAEAKSGKPAEKNEQKEAV